jgi:hypothetical protein
MVTVEVPVVAVPLAANVKALLANDAVTPVGMPNALKLTALVKPPDGVTLIVLEPLAPCVIATLLGNADRLKSGVAAPFTVRLTVAVWLKLPDFPVMVTVEFPVVAVPLAANVKALLTNDAVTPLVMPAAVNVTALLKPPDGVMVIVLEPLAPCVTARLVGDAERLKSGVAAVAGVITKLLE